MKATVRFVIVSSLAIILTAVLACTTTSTDGPTDTEPNQDAPQAGKVSGEQPRIRFDGLDSGYTDQADIVPDAALGEPPQ